MGLVKASIFCTAVARFPMSGDRSDLSGVVNLFSNAFSVLNLDDGDVKDQVASAAAACSSNVAAKGVKEPSSSAKSEAGDKEFSLLERAEKKAKMQQSKSEPTCAYRNPLVWIDLEMTGLDVQVDRILEIACIITDGNLTNSVEGPDVIIHQSKKFLDKMGEWCQDHHGASGLTEKVLQSKVTEKVAEKQVLNFVTKHLGTEHKHLLAGNSVYVDRLFLKKYMPNLADLFSHVVVDVSSVKALCKRWFPRDHEKGFRKENKHRAMDDIRESIMELKFYKQNIFKPSKSGR